MRLASILRTYLALGPRNLARVGLYRIGLKSGLHPVQRLAPECPATAPYFRAEASPSGWPAGDNLDCRSLGRFDHHVETLPAGAPHPAWHANPFGDDLSDLAETRWWRISDFGRGDIKGVWEVSRFGWLFPLAEAALKGDAGAAETLNGWLEAWSLQNAPYVGPNWKCGQEASIRVLHLAAVALMVGENGKPLSGLRDMLRQHLARVRPTIGYALGQSNNHATSEAAALFVGGNMLAAAGDPRGSSWHAAGRRLLEQCARELIMADGSFSQYSVNYHRMMLDAYWFAELWRRRQALPEFSAILQARVGAATEWLRSMVDEETGEAPNIGASDGARLFPFRAGVYRDFRPSVQMASALFVGKRSYPPAAHDDAAKWLGFDLPDSILPAPGSRTFDDGGWHVLRMQGACAVMRFPRFRFRPGHADALHVDLFVCGQNILRDAGTFSYNDPSDPDSDYSSARFHNTVTFDDSDQMPRLSRFLYGDWLRASHVEPVSRLDGWVGCAAGYRDRRANGHLRRLRLSDSGLKCIDELSGRFRSAKLRWRVPPGEWDLRATGISAPGIDIAVTVDGAGATVSLTTGREARHYCQSTPVKVLTVEVDGPCTIMTDVRF